MDVLGWGSREALAPYPHSPSGATQAGAYILPGHWKENFTSAMPILAVMSSSICSGEEMGEAVPRVRSAQCTNLPASPQLTMMPRLLR